jgi:pimeloyl-ACP methyl ester carboxylesterase
MALDDCHDAYRWLRRRGYEPDQIVLAGDSAGGYLAFALAQRLQEIGEEPAALVAISPLMQLAKEPKQAHPNMKTDAMFPAKAFDALVALAASAASKHIIDGKPEELYEPLDHVEPGLPRTLIHVSGSELLLHDARLAAGKPACGPRCGFGLARFMSSSWRRRWCPRRLARCGRLVSTSARPPTRHCLRRAVNRLRRGTHADRAAHQ